MLHPSEKTRLAWSSGYTRHVIRMESVIFVVTLIGFAFAIATGALTVQSANANLEYYAQNPDQGSGYGYGYGEGGYGYSYYDDYYLNYEKTAIWPMVLVAPIVTLVVSGLDIALYYKACLHPIYTLILSIFFLIGWIVTFIFNVGYDYTDAYPDSTAAVAIHAIMSACFGILFCAYFAYMVISAVGVNFRRKAKKVGVKPGDGKLRFVADQPAMATAPAEA